MRESSVILYRCAFVINREAVIWDNRSYQKRQHAYNRLEKLKDEYPYDLKYGKGQWEVCIPLVGREIITRRQLG